MMRISRLPAFAILMAVAVMMAAFTPSCFAQQLKVGFIDLEKIHDKWEKYKSISEKLKVEYDAKNKELLEKKTAINKEMENFMLKKELLPVEDVKKRQEELGQQAQKYDQQLREEVKNWEERKRLSLEPLIEELKKTIEAVAKEEKYSFLFMRSMVFWAEPSYDVSDKVLARLNKK